MRFHIPKMLGGFRAKLKAGMIAEGVPEAEADVLVGKIGDGTLLKLLIEHGGDIVAIIAQIIALFPK